MVKRVVISLGGFYFDDAARIKRIAAALDELAESSSRGLGLYVVTGGGVLARQCISIARELGANEAVCDYIGIAITRVNARLLISALRNAYPEPFYDYDEVAAVRTVEDGKIAVMGGVTPGYTTDAVSALLAEYINADLLLNVTTVDGVYEADPRKYPGARKYDRITPGELVRLTAREELKAGSRIIIDPFAAKIIERSRIRTIVLDGSNPRDIIDAVVHGRHHGTEIG
ncbi:MAG: UMP kinase [Candidatus Methanophagaceae archaeon]|nr:MAG: UMP kinase [Methanophagales archaeon]